MGDWQCDACSRTLVAPCREPLEHDGLQLCGGCHTEAVLHSEIAELKARVAELEAECAVSGERAEAQFDELLELRMAVQVARAEIEAKRERAEQAEAERDLARQRVAMRHGASTLALMERASKAEAKVEKYRKGLSQITKQGHHPRCRLELGLCDCPVGIAAELLLEARSDD